MEICRLNVWWNTSVNFLICITFLFYFVPRFFKMPENQISLSTRLYFQYELMILQIWRVAEVCHQTVWRNTNRNLLHKGSKSFRHRWHLNNFFFLWSQTLPFHNFSFNCEVQYSSSTMGRSQLLNFYETIKIDLLDEL